MTHEDFLRTLPDSQDAVTDDGIPTVADVLERPLMVEDIESDTTVSQVSTLLLPSVEHPYRRLIYLRPCRACCPILVYLI